jgi:hypothetical protein
MNRHFAIAAVISGLSFSAGCGGSESSSDTTPPATEPTPTTSTIAVPTDRTIAGTITYEGDLGSGVIIVVANLVGSNGPPLYSTALTEAGPYALTNVDDGEYTVTAFVDTANDRGAPEAGEPKGAFDANADGTPDSVVIAGGVGVIDIDIALV